MILIDHREGSKTLMDTPPLANSGLVCLSELSSGDVMFLGNGPDDTPLPIGVEVKRIDDLIASQQNGRLGTQLERMQGDYARRWLIVYGQPTWDTADLLVYSLNGTDQVHAVFGNDQNRPIPYAWYFNLCSDVEAAGFAVVSLGSFVEVAIYIARLYRAWTKSWSDRHYLRRVDQSQPMPVIPRYSNNQEEHDRIRRAVKIASALPSLGVVRAVAFATHFPTVREMFNATPQRMCEIEGIGKTTAERIYRFMNQRRLK